MLELQYPSAVSLAASELLRPEGKERFHKVGSSLESISSSTWSTGLRWFCIIILPDQSLVPNQSLITVLLLHR